MDENMEKTYEKSVKKEILRCCRTLANFAKVLQNVCRTFLTFAELLQNLCNICRTYATFEDCRTFVELV